jgi:hypothetical protein
LTATNDHLEETEIAILNGNLDRGTSIVNENENVARHFWNETDRIEATCLAEVEIFRQQLYFVAIEE